MVERSGWRGLKSAHQNTEAPLGLESRRGLAVATALRVVRIPLYTKAGNTSSYGNQ